jgi:hypothetical protein
MNYISIYNSLITQAAGRVKADFKYVERHHIIPKCMGGSNDLDNLVYLTAREHFVAHQLLAKINPSIPGLIYACNLMVISPTGQRNNNRRYEWIKIQNSKLRKTQNKDNCVWIAKMAEGRRGKTAENNPIVLAATEKLNRLSKPERYAVVVRFLGGEHAVKIYQSLNIDMTYTSFARMISREIKKMGIAQKRTIPKILRQEIGERVQSGEAISDLVLELQQLNYRCSEVSLRLIARSILQPDYQSESYGVKHKGRTKEQFSYLAKMAASKQKFSDEFIDIIIEKIEEFQCYQKTADWLEIEFQIEVKYSTLASYYSRANKSLGRQSGYGVKKISLKNIEQIKEYSQTHNTLETHDFILHDLGIRIRYTAVKKIITKEIK